VFLFDIVDDGQDNDGCRDDPKYFLIEADFKNLSSLLVAIV